MWKLSTKKQQQQNTVFHPMVITIFIQINIQINVVGVLAARNNLKVKNARQPVKKKDIQMVRPGTQEQTDIDTKIKISRTK